VRWHGYEKYCQKLTFVTEVAAGPLTLSLLQPLSISNFSHCLAQVSEALHTYLAVLPLGGSSQGTILVDEAPAWELYN